MFKIENFDTKNDILDVPTPRHSRLSGRYKRSSAYHALCTTLPVVLTEIIDDMLKYKDEIFANLGERAPEELKKIVGKLSKLKYELQTNKMFEKIAGDELDCKEWNNFIDSLPVEINNYYRSSWLFTECYVYRKTASFFLESTTFKNHDYFAKKKHSNLDNECVIEIARYVQQAANNFKEFQTLVKLSLWSQRLNEILDRGLQANICDIIDAWDSKIVVNDIKLIWKCLQDADHSNAKIVDIICNNAGFELYTDIVLAEYLIDKQLANKVRFYLKPMPWFVLNATTKDFNNVVNFIQQHTSTYEQGLKWQQYLDNGKFFIAPMFYYWTSPYEYFKMRDRNLNLYNYLSQAHLIIFKGDLHYRKLVGDYAWDLTEDFLTCIRGFQPTNLCALRVLTSDTICGLPYGKSEELKRINAQWTTSGKYAVIQFEEMAECGCKLKKITI